MKEVTKWIDAHSDSPTIMLSTADHECGGLTLGIELDAPPDYWWAPQYLQQSTASVELLAAEYKKFNGTGEDEYVKNLYSRYGVKNPTTVELADAKRLKIDSSLGFVLAQALNSRLGINFATKGHSAVDVSLFGYGKGHEEFIGSHENTEVAGFVTKKLGLKLEPITKKLQAQKDWVKNIVQPQAGDLNKREGGRLANHHH